ncbi:hypothetical protein PHMEG_00022045 [Phytophthora megakarya]|uniref:Ankyrin repeat-containing domain n=1 Tax=Phytophthora megakarya TaxID=4795 RepID=A0A225VL25_9STRA|nr:hypothetical protein PHMEG_00022045 [Phytophthora megakarya]
MIEHIPFPKHGHPGDTIIDTATISGQFNNVMDFVAGSGQVDMFKRLLTHYPEKEVTKDAMDQAECGGHLEMVQWLHANRSEGCTEKAMDEAASRGHFDVVKWLHTHRSEGCTEPAVDGAAANGYLDIWLGTNRSGGCSAEAIQQAVRNGHVGIFYPEFNLVACMLRACIYGY